MTTRKSKAVRRPVRRTRRYLIDVERQFIHRSTAELFALVPIRTHMSGELPRSHQRQELCFPEVRGARSLAIPRQSVTVGGYLRAGEKETPRRSRAHKSVGTENYAHIGPQRERLQAPWLERLVRTEAALRAAVNPKLKGTGTK